MTTIVKAKMKDGGRKQIEAVFPAELDPRFDFVRGASSLKRTHQQRIKFLRSMEPDAVNFQIANIDDTKAADADLDLVEQPRINGQADLLVGRAKEVR